MLNIDKSLKKILGIRKDKRSRNQEDDVQFRGPRRKAREGEQWQKFKTPQGKTVIYLKKLKPSLKDVENIFSSPFLDDVEKEMQATKLGATGAQMRTARMNIRLRRGNRRRRY